LQLFTLVDSELRRKLWQSWLELFLAQLVLLSQAPATLLKADFEVSQWWDFDK
jgi:hypothetical protein